MSEFIVATVNNAIFPLTQNRESLETELSQLKEIRSSIEQNVQELLKERETLYSQHQLHMPKIETRILEYLDRVGSANEFLIAQELKLQASEVYHVCVYLYAKKQIKQDAEGNWII